MFKLQHQFSNIAETSETTQLTNDQMPYFHCHSECSKCPPTAPSSNTSPQSLDLRSLPPSCRSVFVIGCPRYLKRFLEFSDCFWLCFKLVVSLQHCTSHVIVHWVCIWRILWPLVFVMKSGQLAHSQFCALRAVCAGVPSCWKMNPVGSR